MRPVNRGDKPADYDFKLDTDLSTITLKFIDKQVKKVFETSDPTVEQVVNAWLYYVRILNGEIKKKLSKYKDLDENVVELIKKRIGAIYKTAGDPLKANLGSFCSYCESYMTDQPQVEHCIPKAQFPTISLAWDNFLLACGPCNVAKGEDPSRGEVKAWIVKKNPQEEDYFKAIKKNYTWPEDILAYRNMSPGLYYHDPITDNWKKIDEKLSVDNDIAFVKEEDRIITAKIRLKSGSPLEEREIRVMVEATEDKDDRIISLCKLNEFNGDKKIYDNRILRRTILWFDVIKELNQLKDLATNYSAGFESCWNNMLSTLVPRAGFYSVWVRVLQLKEWKDPAGNLLVARFVNETKDLIFPGTKTTKVP